MYRLIEKDLVVCDVECYENYFLVMFKHLFSGKIMWFEKFEDLECDRKNLLHILNKYTMITFNGLGYDQVILEGAVAGFSCSALKECSQMLIEQNMQPWQVRKQMGIGKLDIDHIDIMNVAPLQASLKMYAGRLHIKEMENLPVEPDALIKNSERKAMRTYCVKDLKDTEALFNFLREVIELRYDMSNEYGVDVRSKSDAQIAEEVFKVELKRATGVTAKRCKIKAGTIFKYRPPESLVFNTPELKAVFDLYTSAEFIVGGDGYVKPPEVFKAKENTHMGITFKGGKFQFGSSTYKIGIGGLHSCEKKTRHVAEEGTVLKDIDVEAFYPRIILNNKYFPKHLGEIWLKIFEKIVETRLSAKAKAKECIKASKQNQSLKVVINGTFGKLGNKWSITFSPDLMLHVTITGQLSLLMLVERLELAGVSVVSGNTDGIVLKYDEDLEFDVEEIVEQWEADTGYTMEGTEYSSLNSKDVNNYIAIKPNGKIKAKGAYADRRDPFYKIRSNPANEICNEAVYAFLTDGTPIKKTIDACQDITKFVSVRTVNGGAIKDGVKLGKAVRWYYDEYEMDCIRYVTSGNKVPKSDEALPLMDLPDKIPETLDRNWYVESSLEIIKNIGCKALLQTVK